MKLQKNLQEIVNAAVNDVTGRVVSSSLRRVYELPVLEAVRDRLEARIAAIRAEIEEEEEGSDA